MYSCRHINIICLRFINDSIQIHCGQYLIEDNLHPKEHHEPSLSPWVGLVQSAVWHMQEINLKVCIHRVIVAIGYPWTKESESSQTEHGHNTYKYKYDLLDRITKGPVCIVLLYRHNLATECIITLDNGMAKRVAIYTDLCHCQETRWSSWRILLYPSHTLLLSSTSGIVGRRWTHTYYTTFFLANYLQIS